MKEKSILNRRFVRLEAMQNLYAFSISKQANYQGALDRIQHIFAPDVFADPLVVDKQRQAADQEEALTLFAALVELDQAVTSNQHTYPKQVRVAVQQGRSNYELEVNKDLKKLKNSWVATVDKIQQTSLLVLKLLIEWAQVSKHQSGRTRFIENKAPDWTPLLASSLILERLQANTYFTHLIQQHGVSWVNHNDLVVNWYNQFVKNNTRLPQTPENLPVLSQERQLLEDLVQAIIFEEKVIQDFFSDSTLSWVAHKSIIKKLVIQVLGILQENNQIYTSLELFKVTSEWETAENFYKTLINNVLAQDQAFENLIKQHATNWPIERIVILDKVIIKLALTEMLCMTNIPVKVSINEYLDLSKVYSTPKSSRFINGILDAVAKTL